MRPSFLRRCATRSALLVLCGLSACHGLLDVSDPTLIRDQDIANAAGADSRRLDAVGAFMVYILVGIPRVAQITDERSYDIDPRVNPLPTDFWTLDRRDSEGFEALHVYDDPYLGNLDWIVTRTSIAIPQVRLYSPDSLKGDFLAQLFAYRGYVLLQMAEDVCQGFPINDISDSNIPVYSRPYTTDSAVVYAISQLDSAIADAKDSTQYLNFARVVKGRALLDIGRYAEAEQSIATVPNDFVYTTDVNHGNIVYNPYDSWSYQGFPVGDRKGGNGLRFVSEHDVRVPITYKRQRIVDTTVAEYDQAKYTSYTTTTVLASATEAQLMRAEVALANHDASWLTILNTLRQSVGLADLADPLAPEAQVDTLYHERAFWLYLTGRRLGDLRRLMRNYHRDPETVFPTGRYPLGGEYGTATAIPFSLQNEAQYNRNITTGCTTR